MGWSTERGGVYHPTLADQQQQQPQQQCSPSPRAMHALELYRACAAAGQKVRFTVEQRPEGEYFTLSSRPPPPASQATQAAAAGVRRPRRKPNKRRAEKLQNRRESRRSTTAARWLQQQPLGNGSASDPQQQQQQQARASSSCTPKSTVAAATDSALQQQREQQRTRAAASGGAQPIWAAKPADAATPTMETRSSKKRRIALSPGGAITPATATPAHPFPPPTPISGAIPQTDGAEEAPMTPPMQQRQESGYRPAPPPPPMTRLSKSSVHVLCRRCSKIQHSVHFKYCYKCC